VFSWIAQAIMPLVGKVFVHATELQAFVPCYSHAVAQRCAQVSVHCHCQRLANAYATTDKSMAELTVDGFPDDQTDVTLSRTRQ
jgi:hypothetical protein